jgi:ribonuclease PH
MNVVQTDRGQLLEIQATAEREPFSRNQLGSLLRLADQGIAEIIQIQKDVLKKKSMLFMAYGYPEK